MARKKFQSSAQDPFGDGSEENSEETATSSWFTTSETIYGESSVLSAIEGVDNQRERIKLIRIFDIMPDHKQPRRAVPSTVRAGWDGSSDGIAAMFQRWLEAAETERGSNFNLGAYIENQDTQNNDEQDTTTGKAGPTESAFLAVVKLAASIAANGLTNPVTVAPTSQAGRYKLETGERRWLAYHLLWNWFTDPEIQEEWERIPAREVKHVDVWRQANENNARADLNAISKARQYAILMMDLIGTKHFQPFNAFGHEQAFYAQAVEHRIPHGKGEQMLTAMGVVSRSALTYYRNMLELPNEIWQGGDDLNLSEEQLYNLAKLPEAIALAKYKEIVSARNNSSTSTPQTVTIKEHGPGTKRHFAALTRAVKKAGQGKDKDNAEALKTMEEMRRWLDDQERRIRQFLE